MALGETDEGGGGGEKGGSAKLRSRLGKWGEGRRWRGERRKGWGGGGEES